MSKGQVYADALDLARQEGRWHDVLAAPKTAQGLTWPELIRKFNKHNPNERLTSLTAELELQTQQCLRQAASDQHFDFDGSHEQDCPFQSFPHYFRPRTPVTVEEQQNITPILPPLVQAAAAQTELRQSIERLREARTAHAAQGVDVAAPNIVLGLAEYALGNFDAAGLLLSQSVQQQQDSKPPSTHLSDLLLAASTVQGLILERSNKHREALECYNLGLQFHRLCSHTSPELTRWAEKASYRRALLSKTFDAPSALVHHQEYASDKRRPLKHAIVLRSHLYLLCASPSEDHLQEVLRVEEEYEALLRRVTSFPRAGDVNTRLLDFIDCVYGRWLSLNSEAALKEHTRHEVDESDTLRVIAILERALAYTFQSHRILRYLLTLHMALNNKTQALKAFDLYHKLWEKARETDLVNVSRKLRRFRNEDESSGALEKIRQQSPQNEASSSASAAVADGQPHSREDVSPEEEADIDRPLTYIGACCLAAKVYCSDPRAEDDASKASALMKRAAELIPEGTSNQIRASVQKWSGVANGCQAYDEANSDLRPQLMDSALKLLYNAVALNPASFESHYHLALIQAEHGQNGSALQALQAALKMNPASSEAWNLLVLLTSSTKSHRTSALQLATHALHGHPGAAEDAHTLLQELQLDLPIPDISNPSTFSALRALVQLRMTRTVLIEALEGPQSALISLKELYASFAHDFALFLQEERNSSSSFEAKPSMSANPAAAAAAPSHHPHLQAAAASLKLPSRRFSLRSRRSRRTSGNATMPSRPESVANSISPASSRPASIQEGVDGLDTSDRGRISSHQSNGASMPTTGTATQGFAPTSSSSLFQHRRRQARELEQTLWLLTAATFRRSGDLEQSREAIYEAEKINPMNPDVWVQLGLLYAEQAQVDLALECMDKALTFDLDHVPALVHLARLLKSQRQENAQLLDLAAGYMEECSRCRGHATPEVWLTLGEVYELQGRREEAKAILLEALRLSELQPVRSLESAVPRIL